MANQKSLKFQILTVILKKAKESKGLNKRKYFKFDLDYVVKEVELIIGHDELHRPSISREIRKLKEIGILNYRLVGKKVEATYMIPLESKRYDKKSLTKYLEDCMVNLETISRKTPVSDKINSLLGIENE